MRLMRAIVVIVVLLAVTAGAGAQRRHKDLRNPWSMSAGGAPENVAMKDKTPIVAVVYALASTAAIGVVGFKKPRRTHLD